MFNYLRFRYRRALRRAKRELRVVRKWSGNYVQRHIWGKWHQIRLIRKFLALWWIIAAVAFVGLLQQIGALQQLASVAVPEPGGTYTEAAVGTVGNLNPVLPESATTDDINQLIFSGLTRYDSAGHLVADLATSWHVSSDGLTYTFHLRHGVKWQDGVPFTSADVAFTLTAIQNPDSRSPLASSWQGVTVATPDQYTVTFTLPEPLNSFLDSTTLGIVPQHLLEDVNPSMLRVASFNQNPIGTGPFKIKTFAPSAGEIDLVANPNYYLGKPKLDDFVFKLYSSPAATLVAFEQHQVTSPGQILPSFAAQASVEPGLATYTYTVPEEQTLFFNTKDPSLSDAVLRTILTRSIDRTKVLQAATGGQGVVVTQPLLPGQLGYTDKYAQSYLSPAAAETALNAAGWTLPKQSSVREKNGSKLQLKLVTLSGSPLGLAAAEIKRQWAAIGIDLSITTVGQDQLEQTYMRPRNFQMLLYGINVGADPDVYSFWHSSQAVDPGINLSGYDSTAADKALEDGRIKTDQTARIGYYNAFLQAWNTDEPAAVLYQSEYVYGTRQEVGGLTGHRLIVPEDRYYNVQDWTVLQRTVPVL
jgi:peptide/nickel transport system substrate-binding protein